MREGKLIFARGFGLANVADKTPVTPETRFFIGSTTKAFTATLVGMLVDEGVMRWDDPADRHLPYFKLAVDSDDPAARATLRDLLSHRTGFPRMSMLLANGVLSPEEILRQASQAEPFSRFRQRFHYNNEQYLAAGWAAAAAAGRPWDELTRSRILNPLGMTNTEPSARRGNVPSTMRFEDYRLVNGVRLPFRQVDSNDQMGRTVYEVERVEFDVKVDDELFVLRRPEEIRR